MSIPSPTDLLEQARELVREEQRWPKQVDLRRAISTAYYAVFHSLCGHATHWVLRDGKRAMSYEPDAVFVFVYRSLDHGPVRTVCEAVAGRTDRTQLAPAGGWSPALKDAARSTVTLQDERHTADYDPGRLFAKSDARIAVENAARGIGQFDVALLQNAEREAFLSLLLFRTRQVQRRAR